MKKRSGFTLVEILVVLAIIAVLAALLFPAFRGAQENGRQANCASNLQQIYFAVQQYRKDEGAYPDTIVDLLGEGTKYDNGGVAAPLGNNAPGYLKGGASSLTCLDDDTLSDLPRSSYGLLSKVTPSTAMPSPLTTSFTGDFGQYVWNYWGYRDDGFAYLNESEAGTGNGGTTACNTTATNPCRNLANPGSNFVGPHDPNPNLARNVVKYSLSNKFAPLSTIITHCVYHRINTANNLSTPGELYVSTDPQAGAKARDILLRLDGSAKALDISEYKSADTTKPNVWQMQTP